MILEDKDNEAVLDEEQQPETEAETKPAEEEQQQLKSEEPKEELVVTFGEEEPEEEKQPAPAWVRELRKSHREIQKENRRLKQQLEVRQGGENQPPAPGAKPKLEDFDYDPNRFELALEEWHQAKTAHAAAVERKKAAEKQEQESWHRTVSAYEEAKQKLSVSDFEDAEESVLANFSQVQQGMILAGADNPALVVYALGKNPKKLAELASVKDNVKFAFAVAKLETQLKMRKKSTAPEPEPKVKGAARSSGSVDSTLERLRAEAEKSGDFSKLVAYKRQLRDKER